MSGRESRRAALEAICRTILPAAFDSGRTAGAFFSEYNEGPAGADADPARLHLPTLVERRIESLPPRHAAGVRLVVRLVGGRSLVCALTGRPVRFQSLSDATRAAMLRRMETSAVPGLRMMLQVLRRVILSSWYSEPAAQAEVGHLPPLGRREPVFEWEGGESAPVGRAAPAAAADATPRERALVHRLARGLEPGRRLSAEVVVVGSGAGGAVAAAILAEAGRDVLLLEEGRAWPLAERTGIERDLVPRLYADAGARATDDQSIQILQGRALGGSTFVNWMLMLRTPDEVLHDWSTRHGMEGVDAASMAPLFAEIEREVATAPVAEASHSRNNRILMKGAMRLGLDTAAATINARGCERSGLCGVGCPWAAKQSVDETWLPRALRAGARIAIGARVRRIERSGPDAGRLGARKRLLVEVTGANGRPSGQAMVETPLVILAAGAVGTPSLLQRSGLGGGGVGRFLRLHPTSAVVALHDEPVHAATGIPMSAVCRPEPATDAYGYWLECPPMHPGLAAVALPGFGERHRRVMLDYARLATTIVLVRDGADAATSQGAVRTDARGRPRIRYRLGEAELATMRRGITTAARLQLAAGAREVTTLHAHGNPIRTEADLGRIAAWPDGPNELCVFSAHVMGSARIGTHPGTSACRPDGQRHGARGIHVMDGSLLPTAPGVNPQETIMALALLLARRLA